MRSVLFFILLFSLTNSGKAAPSLDESTSPRVSFTKAVRNHSPASSQYKSVQIAAKNFHIDQVSCDDFFMKFNNIFLEPLDKANLDFEAELGCGRQIPSYQVLIYASDRQQQSKLDAYLNTYQNYLFMNHRVTFERVEKVIYDITITARYREPNGSMGDPLGYNYFIRDFNDVKTYEDFVYSTMNHMIMQAPIDDLIQFLISEAGEEQVEMFKQALRESNYIQGMGEIWFISSNNVGWKKSGWHSPFRDCSKNSNSRCI
jgi:hypothetical protein